RPVADAVPVAVAGVSAFDPYAHAEVQLLVDHTPVEHYSPDNYIRTFLEGEDCWLDCECKLMRTENDATKENALMTLDYIFLKDFRWIDLNLPDPSSVEPGEDPINEGDPRWGFVARSWTTQSWEGRKGKAFIWQSFTLEIWIPRDGEGFIRSSSDKNTDDGDWTTDSDGGGTLRLLSLWVETEFVGLSVSDEVVAGTTMSGIDKNYEAVEEYLEEND
ncbi:MAG: hypothetical protein HN348_06695, partial [Proteobacteria bacterium]|nr:hypothetical protein [Pseudomonadota bacterium]